MQLPKVEKLLIRMLSAGYDINKSYDLVKLVRVKDGINNGFRQYFREDKLYYFLTLILYLLYSIFYLFSRSIKT